MTVQIDIYVLIIIVVAIVLAVFLVQMIWQMKKTAQKTDLLIDDLRTELMPSLHDLREIMERLNRVSVKIEKGSGNAENAATLILGIKAASRVFSQKKS